MKKVNKKVLRGVASVVCVVAIILIAYATSGIERKKWVLYTAQQNEPFFHTVAHGIDLDASVKDDPMFALSEPIEVVCEAKRGKLVLTDKTNGKTWEGTYQVTSLGYGRWGGSSGASYRIVIHGVEGTANISSAGNRTLFVSIGGYTLYFDAD